MNELVTYCLEIFLLTLYISTVAMLMVHLLKMFTFGGAVLFSPLICFFSLTWPVCISLWFIFHSLKGDIGVITAPNPQPSDDPLATIGPEDVEARARIEAIVDEIIDRKEGDKDW